MKLYAAILLLTVSTHALAQSDMDSIEARFRHGFLTITYDQDGKPDIDTALLNRYLQQRKKSAEENRCRCFPLGRPGEPVPDSHPNARFINDPDLWEWKEDAYGRKSYDVKDEYKDTIHRNDGSVVEIAVWHKDPHWIKPQKTTDTTNKNQQQVLLP